MTPLSLISSPFSAAESGQALMPNLTGLAQLRNAGPLLGGGGDQAATSLLLQQQTLMNQSLLQMMDLLLRLMSANGGGAGAASGSSGAAGGSAGGSSGGGSSSATPAVGGKDMGNGWISPLDNYKVTSGFGPRKPPTAASSSNHKGLDMAAPMNTPVRAAKAGTVTISRDDSGGYGKWIEVKHADGSRTRYPHLNARDAQVGAQVAAGQVIGKVGSTGNSTGPHLHFEVIDPSGKNIDPATILKG